MKASSRRSPSDSLIVGSHPTENSETLILFQPWIAYVVYIVVITGVCVELMIWTPMLSGQLKV